MATSEVNKEQWSAYFHHVTRALEGKQALVEVGALPLGNQIAATWLSLRGITYDRKDDLLDLDLGEVDHLIRHPVSIHVDVADGQIHSIEIIDDAGTQHLVRLREPLMLPPPA